MGKLRNTHDNGRLFGFDGANMWIEQTLDTAQPTEAHTLGAVKVEPDMATNGEVMGYTAEATCSCGELVSGRCTSPGSARQWLATEAHYHRNQGRAAFEVVAQVRA